MSERITFDRSLYSPDAVEAAAEAYAEYAKIAVSPGTDAIVAEVSDTGDLDPQTVAHAFCNHVLHETIARRRQAALDEVG